MSNRVTLADIAQISGVSPSTVSLVLRSKPGIAHETRQRVLEAARALGYRPPQSGGRPPTLHRIGVVLRAHDDDVLQANPFYAPVLAGIESACRAYGAGLIYTTVLVDEDNRPAELSPLLPGEAVDGLLVIGVLLDESFCDALRARSCPVVLVDAYAAEPHDAVVTQDFEGAYQAVSYLIDRGHRDIGLVAGPSDAFPSLRERRRAYLRALRDHGIEDDHIANSTLRRAGKMAVEATAHLLQQHPQITALFGCNDLLAIRGMQAARSVSRKVPDDLSVVGFDDIEAAHLVMPALTTMRVDKPGMGRMAVQMLVQRLQHPELPPIMSALATRLIERQSVRDIHPGPG